jgi:hypothetical protein
MKKEAKTFPSTPEYPGKLTEKQTELLNRAEKAMMTVIRPDSGFTPMVPNVNISTNDDVSFILKNLEIPDDVNEHVDSKFLNIAKVSISDNAIEENIKANKITEYDRAVLEACYSQILGTKESNSNGATFTTSMIYKTMTGKTEGHYISLEQQRVIDESITKCMYTPVSVEVIDVDKNGNMISYTLSGPLLPATRASVTIQGTRASAYKIDTMPVFLKYCIGTDNISAMPLQMLSVEMNYTKKSLSILNVLQRFVSPVVYRQWDDTSGNVPDPITLEYSIFYESDSEYDKTRPGKKRVRDTVHFILDDWVGKNYISKWRDIIGKRNAVIAVEISFLKKPVRPLKMYTINMLEDSK